MKLKKLVNVLCSNDNNVDGSIAFVLFWEGTNGEDMYADVDIEYISKYRDREILMWLLEWNQEKKRIECIFCLK